MGRESGRARLGPVEELDLRPIFQPIVDLRSSVVVGYEALMRSGPEDGELHGAEELLEAARREDSTVALDLAARDAALRLAADHGLDAPFSLFLNADPETLDAGSPELPSTPFTLLVEVTEAALIARPEAMLRGLTRLRSAGWGIALDEFGSSPLLGVGPGNFEKRYIEFGLATDDDGPITTHNAYLNILAELGLPGLVLFLGYLAVSWRLLRRRIPDDPATNAFQSSLAAGFVIALALAASLWGHDSRDGRDWKS